MRKFLLLLLLLLAVPALAPAQEFELPGLSRDASAYQRGLTQRFPAGGTPQQRTAADQRVAAAERANNQAALAAALEERIGLGNATPDLWLALARAQLARTPPEAARALQAAWRNFEQVPGGAPEIPSLLLMAQALQRLDRHAQAVEALEAVVQRADTPENRTRLSEARRAAGMLVRRVSPEPDAEPARACIAFTIPPAKRDDWRPEDWIRADPPIPGLGVVREGDQLCVAGLPWGRTTRVVLRQGLPAEEKLNLRAETVVPVTMPNRAPRIVFDTSRFVLPRGQEPRVTVATINVAALSLRLVRISERNLVTLRRDVWKPGQELESWNTETVSEEMGRVVWEGRAEIPRGEANRTQRTALPLPDALRASGPGLYVLVARAGDEVLSRAVFAALPVIATDLGLTAWRGADGIAVQARGLGDARPRAGVKVALMARNNDILAEAVTDAAGVVRFAAALLRGRGAAGPVAVHAEIGDDLAALDLEAAAFDLSDRGATGQPHPGAIDAFLWLDRGIYRPGETVQASVLLRDAGGAPLDLPARIRVKRPNGQLFAEIVPPRLPGAAMQVPVQLSANAPAGQWTLEVLADPDAPPIGSTTFRVDAFVPERMEVTAGPAPGPLVPGRPLEIPVTARFLYGAPAAELSGTAELRLSVTPEPFPEWRGWRFGQASEQFAPDLQSFEIPETDDQGRTTLTLNLPTAPDTTRPLRAEVSVAMAEPGGRESRARFEVPVRATHRLVAVRPLFADDAVNDGAEAGFEIAAVSPEGQAVPATLRVRLVRERPSWRIVVRGSVSRYETVYIDEPVDSANVEVAPGRPARFARALPFGRYRLEAADPGGLGITSIRFRAGWAVSESPDVPDKVDLAADRRAYAPGETARLRIQPPYGGRASVAVLTDRLVSTREFDIPDGGAEVEVPVDASWGPGAYVAVTVFRPGEARRSPGRALGLAWVGVDPAARRLEVAIETPERIRPRQRIEVPVRVSGAQGSAMLTLAAVDEGILRLTSFVSPDPVGHFLGRRRLGVDIRDDYGRLIAPAEGEATTLRQGGDEGEGAGTIDIPQRTVALFVGPVAVGADGVARIALDIPDFAGELRLMVVAWEGNRVGQASKPLTVRDPIIAEALLPRFLAPGDEARLPVLLHNLELPAGEIVAELSAEGALRIAGPTRLPVRLATGARALPSTTLAAQSASGEGVVWLAVTGPDGFRVVRESRLTVRSSRPRVTEVQVAELPAARELPIQPPTERFVPGTWRASASFGGAVRFDAPAMLRAVENFPLYCLEQAASRALALSAHMADGMGGPDRAERMQRAVSVILDRQRYDGGFGLWSAQGNPEPWLSPYAVEALIRARAAGAAVPDAPLNEALKFLEEQLDYGEGDRPEDRAAQVYRLYALSLANRHKLGTARRMLEQINDLPTPIAKAQLAAAFARAGDATRAEQAFTAALATPARRFWLVDYGSAARDLLATAVMLKESGLLAGRMAELTARLPGPELTPAATSTQEQAWAVLAAGLLGRDGRPARIALNGQDLPPAPLVTTPITGPSTARNLGLATVWQTVSATGLPIQPLPAARNQMRIVRRFFQLDGQPLNLDQLRQNQVFVLQLEGRAETGEAHQAMLTQGLPAGWEIVGRMGPGDVAGMGYVGTLTETASQPALDDRFAAAVDLTAENQIARLAIRVRAVTPGRFELPGAEIVDMYRPSIFARQNTGRVTVQAAD